jgi:hypothetical protein
MMPPTAFIGNTDGRKENMKTHTQEQAGIDHFLEVFNIQILVDLVDNILNVQTDLFRTRQDEIELLSIVNNVRHGLTDSQLSAVVNASWSTSDHYCDLTRQAHMAVRQLVDMVARLDAHTAIWERSDWQQHLRAQHDAEYLKPPFTVEEIDDMFSDPSTTGPTF